MVFLVVVRDPVIGFVELVVVTFAPREGCIRDIKPGLRVPAVAAELLVVRAISKVGYMASDGFVGCLILMLLWRSNSVMDQENWRGRYHLVLSPLI